MGNQPDRRIIMTRNLIIIIFFLTTKIFAQTTDTINVTDSNGNKQGQWVVTGKNRPGTCYKPDKKAEEGKYKDNRKTGVWTEYFCNGKIKNILTFKNGRLEGPAKTYYENGKIKEEGTWTWTTNRWIGKYKSYSEDGKVQEYIFDGTGKREGPKTNCVFDTPVIEGKFSSSPDSVIKEYKEVDKKDTLKPK